MSERKFQLFLLLLLLLLFFLFFPLLLHLLPLFLFLFLFLFLLLLPLPLLLLLLLLLVLLLLLLFLIVVFFSSSAPYSSYPSSLSHSSPHNFLILFDHTPMAKIVHAGKKCVKINVAFLESGAAPPTSRRWTAGALLSPQTRLSPPSLVGVRVCDCA